MSREKHQSGLKTLSSVTIPSKYKGPPDIANGGYVCSLFAEYIGGAIDVMIKRPTPLDRELHLCAGDDGTHYLMDGEQMIISAMPGIMDLSVPDAPGYEEAVTAAQASLALKPTPYTHVTGHGIHPICFCCGADVPEGEGLKIHPGRVPGTNMVAAPWTPTVEHGDEQGYVRPEFLWTALDCPGAYALWELTDTKPGFLGRLIGRIEKPLRCGEPCVVAAWPTGSDGRKLYTGTALFDAKGQIVGRSLATWFLMPPEMLRLLA
ncbi:MAG: hypothetical protein KA113_11905 [Syntrophaceae bacterium]|jgi:hypothetical protein|nr:hypothetical protein [Syntrophaceae bacterium]